MFGHYRSVSKKNIPLYNIPRICICYFYMLLSNHKVYYYNYYCYFWSSIHEIPIAFIQKYWVLIKFLFRVAHDFSDIENYSGYVQVRFCNTKFLLSKFILELLDSKMDINIFQRRQLYIRIMLTINKNLIPPGFLVLKDVRIGHRLQSIYNQHEIIWNSLLCRHSHHDTLVCNIACVSLALSFQVEMTFQCVL